MSEILDKIFSKLSEKSELIRPIVPIEKWIVDPYYVGPDGLKIWPFWREHIIDIFSGGQKYNEVILTGSIGIGKSSIGLYIVLRKLYEISCYRNIAELFDLMSTAYTVFVYFSVAKFQAERTSYSQFRSMIDTIPYFKENFPRKDNLQSSLKFPENVMFIYGTQSSDVIGMNVLASILDEANFFDSNSQEDKDNYSKVTELYESIMSRNASRFISRGSVNKSLSILISSSTYKSSFTERRILAAQGKTNVKIVHARLWEAKPKGTFSDKYFHVFVGNEKYDPFVVDSVLDLNAVLGTSFPMDISVDDALRALPHEISSLVDQVPVDFYDIYKNNVIRGLQDISGFSVAPQGKLFTARNLFNDSLIDGYDLFTKYSFVISTQSDELSNTIQFYLSNVSFEHLECPRYLHFDLSAHFDPTGVGCVYKYGTKVIDGKELPVFNVDFALRIMPPPEPKRISIQRVVNFLYHMRDKLKINIAKVTFDQFQCLDGNSVVTTDTGPVLIRDLEKGQLVLTDSGYRSVNNKFIYSDAPRMRIVSTRGASLIGTPNHRIRVLSRWSESKELVRHAQENYFYKGKCSKCPIWEWKQLDQLKVGDIVDYRVNVFDTGLLCDGYSSREQDIIFYLIGFYLGDGYICKSSVRFVCGSYSEAEYISSLLEELFNIKFKLSGKGKNQYQINTHELYNIFVKLGIEKLPSYNKFIPSELFRFSNKLLANLVSGYLDSDGSIDSEVLSVRFTSTSLRLLKDIQYICQNRLGIHSVVSSSVILGGETIVCGTKCIAKDKYTMGISGDLSILFSTLGRKIQKRVGHNGSWCFHKIKSVEFIDNGDVYDVEIDGVHEYIANGFYTHNSVSSRQQLAEDNFNVDYLSVDRTDEQYLFYTQLFYEGRIRIPRGNADLIANELFNLNHFRSRHKVDHPGDSSTQNYKDLSDGLVGALWNAQVSKDTFVNLDDVRNFSSFTLDSDYVEEIEGFRRPTKEELDDYRS